MGAHVIVHPDSYYDSVVLMRISQALEGVDGLEQPVVAMATPLNRELLQGLGYGGEALSAAGPNDLVVAFRSASLTPDDVAAEVERLLSSQASPEADEEQPTSVAAAIAAMPESNLVLISVPGEHAAREAMRALALGRHAMVFSDNVAVDDEIALKVQAKVNGLLMMGPDCGTAIIDGKPLGFANVVRRGSIGVIGASGTGLQEVTCCIDRWGGGVSQAIGVGGRDLSDAVGGLTTQVAIEALGTDPATEVLVVVSKPPSPSVAERVVAALKASGKPSVVHFVGMEAREAAEGEPVFADSLAETGRLACELAGAAVDEAAQSGDLAAELAERFGRAAPSLLGLFCGGTLAYEALVLIARTGLEVRSNLGLAGASRLSAGEKVDGHIVLDLGADEYTRGRPHPMIEPELRNEHLAAAAERGGPLLLLCDVVLGYGSHDDPAGVLVGGVNAARESLGGEPLVAIASVTGTPGDPQDANAQRRRLEDAGITVASDNRRAVELAAAVLQGA